ncbi:unnamed protein product [marine sediment metagenome]|uniref:Uncharacterized protein n=1 Tax=marine sediment metagenome TaxID=412755 RepID=X1IIF8_9ZZZZ
MKRKDMIRRLDAGEKAIDLSIEKFEDMLNGNGSDDGSANCACCYTDGEGSCTTCAICRYDAEQWKLSESGNACDDAFSYDFCSNLPSETDKEGLKKAIEYMKRVKQWMIEKGEYE